MAACASPSIADESLSSTGEKKNFQRLSRLLMCGGVRLLREVFDTIHLPADLPVKLNDPATKMLLKGAKLTKQEWDCVYPSAGICGKSTDFDITLLFRLLRTICYLSPPATGWDKLPNPTDHTLEADLARIKFYRNSVYGHNHTMEITDTDFANLWREISEALLRIAGTISTVKRDEWKKSINNLLHDSLTPDAERYVAELQLWCKKDMDTKDEVEKLGNKIEQMKIMLQELTDKNNQQMDILLKLQAYIDIYITVESTKPGRSSITHSRFPNTLSAIVQQPGLQSESACIPGALPPEQPQTEGAVGMSSRWELQQNLPTDLDIWQVILSTCNFPILLEKLRMKFGGDVHSSRLKSLVLTVSCSSLEVLEGLWNSYCSGHLSKMVQETLITAEVLQELCLSEVKLKTIISEEEYKACKELFTQGNENPQRLCAEETSTRETPSITAMTSADMDGKNSLKIQEAASQGAVMVPTSLDNRPVSDRELRDIGSSLRICWKRLGRCLGIYEKDLETIDMREHDVRKKGISILNMWKETWGEYATGVTLQEALEEIGRPDLLKNARATVIEPTSLENRPVSYKLLDDLVENFDPSWKIVGRQLGIYEEALTNIDMKNQHVEEKYAALFRKWKRKNGDEATVKVLSEALEKIGRSDLSTKVKATGMEPNTLEETPVSPYVLNNLAENFNPTWKILGRHLGIPEDALTNIDMENRLVKQKYVAMLDKWKKRKGHEATVTALSKALEKAGRNDLAKKIKGERKIP